MPNITLTLTAPEAQALADLIDRETRIGGAQAAATYGGIMRQIIEGAQAAQQQDEATEAEET